jgi:hypothetical protein
MKNYFFYFKTSRKRITCSFFFVILAANNEWLFQFYKNHGYVLLFPHAFGSNL